MQGFDPQTCIWDASGSFVETPLPPAKPQKQGSTQRILGEEDAMPISGVFSLLLLSMDQQCMWVCVCVLGGLPKRRVFLLVSPKGKPTKRGFAPKTDTHTHTSAVRGHLPASLASGVGGCPPTTTAGGPGKGKAGHASPLRIYVASPASCQLGERPSCLVSQYVGLHH